ncbi:unnamed protein product [Heterobilharzia americana]|nr:unnamed protein product [Heterobilharzia americana]
MNLRSISDQLPTYPNNIQGELRLILQTKDIFLVCYKHLEEYLRLVNEQNRLITKEFVQEQLQIGEDELTELKVELQEAENRLSARLRHNELLVDQLASLGYASVELGTSVRHLALCRSPQMRKKNIGSTSGWNLGLLKVFRNTTSNTFDRQYSLGYCRNSSRSKGESQTFARLL